MTLLLQPNTLLFDDVFIYYCPFGFFFPTLIVGGGSAGCVLASRLSEDGTKRVLLLEAGGDDRGLSIISVPMAGMELRRSEYDWNYSTVPQKHALQGFEGQVLQGIYTLSLVARIHRNLTSFEAEPLYERKHLSSVVATLFDLFDDCPGCISELYLFHASLDHLDLFS